LLNAHFAIAEPPLPTGMTQHSYVLTSTLLSSYSILKRSETCLRVRCKSWYCSEHTRNRLQWTDFTTAFCWVEQGLLGVVFGAFLSPWC